MALPILAIAGLAGTVLGCGTMLGSQFMQTEATKEIVKEQTESQKEINRVLCETRIKTTQMNNEMLLESRKRMNETTLAAIEGTRKGKNYDDEAQKGDTNNEPTTQLSDFFRAPPPPALPATSNVSGPIAQKASAALAA